MNDQDFAELARRCLDGRASESEQALLNDELIAQPELATEFASIARFDAMLKDVCRREAKALFEFVALEAAMPEAPVVRAPVIVTATASRVPWLRIAAGLLFIAAISAMWFRGGEPATIAEVATSTISTVRKDGKFITIQPRSQPAPVIRDTQPTQPEPMNEPTLTARLNDYYLPEVDIQQATARQAIQLLAAQMREHNYAKRKDLDALAITMPAALENKEVTLKSGPITMAKAVEVVAALADGEATIGNRGIAIAYPRPIAQTWFPNFALPQVQRNAAALGIAGTAPTPSQTRALAILDEAQKQVSALAPLRFVPLVVPTSRYGSERVLTAAEIASIRAQLAQATPGSLPVLTLPFGAAAPQFHTSKGRAISFTVTPVGENNLITIDPGPTDNLLGAGTGPVIAAVTPKYDANGNALTGTSTTATTTSTTTGAQAVLEPTQGVITEVTEDEDEIIYTDAGIPIPKSQAHLYGITLPTSTGTALALIPAGNG
jgi:hypothetical protein